MSKNNESLKLVLAILATIGVIFGGLWFLVEQWTEINSRNRVSASNQSLSESLSNLIGERSKCKVDNLPEGTFNYGGSTTWAPIRKNADSVLQSICPQFLLRYTQPVIQNPGSGSGIEMLIDNQLSFSQSSRSVKGDENQKAQQKGFSLKEIPVAIDGIAIAVNPKLNIPGLTITQIKGIYTGRITNWQEVGGVNLPITSYSRSKEASGTVEFFIENVLNNENFGPKVNYIGTTTEALRKVAVVPGGIYFASAPEIIPQCMIKPLPVGRTSSHLVSPYLEPFVELNQCPHQRNQLNAQAFRSGDYPITRNLFVIVKQNIPQDQQAGEAYANWLLTPQGQELIEKTGFVKIR